jgi:Rod binding domain-containing protein
MNATHTHSGHPASAVSPSAAAAAYQKRHQALVRQTQKWVAQTFYGTMLKKMRESPFHSDIFDGGRGGQMFHELMDQQLADRMSRNAAPKLVDSIVQKIERGKASASYMTHSKKSAAEIKAGMSPLNSHDVPLEGESHGATLG